MIAIKTVSTTKDTIAIRTRSTNQATERGTTLVRGAAARWEDELVTFRGANDDGWAYFRDRFRDEHLATLAPKTMDGFGTALPVKFAQLALGAQLSASDITVT